MTRAQRAALDELWVRFALPVCHNPADLNRAFGRSRPITLEIGTGDGTNIVALAATQANDNYIAVEVYRPGLGQLLSRVNAQGLQNIRICDRDVCDFLSEFEEAVFDRVLIFFPDPWPKKRHHKRRLINASFLDSLAPRIHRHGRLFLTTDDQDYALSIADTVADHPQWQNLAGGKRYCLSPKFRSETKFERRARRAASPVFEFLLARA